MFITTQNTTHRDNQIVPATHRQLATGTLVLQNVRPADSGNYTCAAVNSITGAEIRMHHRLHLTVSETTPRSAPALLLSSSSSRISANTTALLTTTTRFSVRIGNVVVLECPGHGNPVPHAVWSRPDASISAERSTPLDYGLQIVDVQPSDAGTYVCRLDNGIAPALVHTVRLDVLQAPYILSGPDAAMTDEGERLVLDCDVRGTPSPDVYWLINGIEARTDAEVQVQNGTRMVLRAVQKRHAGVVQCFARNEVGEVSDGMMLEVKPKQIPGGGDTMSGGGAMEAGGFGVRPTSGRGSMHGGGGGGRDGGGNGANGAGGKAKGHNKHKHGEYKYVLFFYSTINIRIFAQDSGVAWHPGRLVSVIFYILLALSLFLKFIFRSFGLNLVNRMQNIEIEI